MIRSKEDYRMFLREDALANIKSESCSWFKMRLNNGMAMIVTVF